MERENYLSTVLALRSGAMFFSFSHLIEKPTVTRKTSTWSLPCPHGPLHYSLTTAPQWYGSVHDVLVLFSRCICSISIVDFFDPPPTTTHTLKQNIQLLHSVFLWLSWVCVLLIMKNFLFFVLFWFYSSFMIFSLGNVNIWRVRQTDYTCKE